VLSPFQKPQWRTTFPHSNWYFRATLGCFASGTPPPALAFAQFIVSFEGQKLLVRHGFAPAEKR
jgi:hypothetical protein